MQEASDLRVLNINDILPNRFQPRLRFDQDALEQLAESINKFGVIEPIVVRPIGTKFEIIAGERRYKASKLASRYTIPAIVVNMSDKESEELALLENVQRQALNPIEEAVSYKRILDMGYISREELSKRIGKPQSEILNKIKLLELSDEVQSYLLNNKISERHAKSLLKITNLDKQVEMLHRIVNERLTVKQTDREIRKLMEEKKEIEAEDLFEEEKRGNENMDIDKIMREAQDINPQQPVAVEPAPDLMAKGNEVASEPIVSTPEPEPVVVQEPNKFVNLNVPAEAENSQGTVNQQPVTFDGMFNSPIDVVPTNGGEEKSLSEIVAGAFQKHNDPALVGNQEENTSAVSSVGVTSPQEVPVANEVVQPAPISYQAPQQIVDQPVVTPAPNEVPAVTPTPVPEPVNPAPVINNVEINAQPTGEVPFPNVNVPETAVPNVDIYQKNGVVDNVAPVQQVNPEPALASNVVVDNVPPFAKVIKMLRDCADQIEKEGHFVNLEELDLDNQYKVIFTIDK